MRRHRKAIGVTGVLSVALLAAACSDDSGTDPAPGDTTSVEPAVDSIDVHAFEPQPGGQETAAEAIAALLHFNAQEDIDGACTVALTPEVAPEAEAVVTQDECIKSLKDERALNGTELRYEVDGIEDDVWVEDADVRTLDLLTLWGQPTQACFDAMADQCGDGVRYTYAVAGVEGSATTQDGFTFPKLQSYYAVQNEDDGLWYVLLT